MIKQFNIKTCMGNISALTFEPEITNNVGVLFMHGFGHHKCETASLFTKIAKKLYENNVCSLLFDFYGFGDSDGVTETVTFDTMLENAKIAFEFLKKMVSKVYLVSCGISATISCYFFDDIKMIIAISPRFDPFPSLEKLHLINTDSIIEISDYLDNITFVNYLRSLGADSGNMGGYKMSRLFIESFLNKKPSYEILQHSNQMLLIHAENDFILYTQSYQKIINLCQCKIIKGAERFFVDAKKQDEIIKIVSDKILNDDN